MAGLLVPVKAVPVGTPMVRVSGDSSWIDTSDWRLDPVNELTIEWATRARAGGLARATAVSVDTAKADDALRSALARGCTDALRIAVDDPDLASTARLLAAAAQRVGAGIVAFGYESYDASSGALPAATAAALGWPLVSRARDAHIEAEKIRATRSSGSGGERVEAPMPAVLSFVEGAIVVRQPRLARVLSTRRARIESVAAGELAGEHRLSSWTEGLVGMEARPARARDTRVMDVTDGVPALAALAAAARVDARIPV